MIAWDVSYLLDAAQRRADQAVVTERRRITTSDRAGIECGALGELVIMEYLRTLRIDYEDTSSVNCDLTTPYGTIDVKSKRRTVPPRADYACTVPAYVFDKQRPDYYVFVSMLATGRTLDTYLEAYILGAISHATYYVVAEEIAAGGTDDGRYRAHVDQLNVPISLLKPLPGLLLSSAARHDSGVTSSDA